MNGIKWGRVAPTQQHDKIIIVASGPSLKNFNMGELKDKGTIICVNNAGNFVPFADYWFTLDPWGLNRGQVPKNFAGKLFAAVPDDYGRHDAKATQHRTHSTPNVTYLHRLMSHNYTNQSSDNAYTLGLSPDTGCISTGNSGFGALNLAYHMKPKKILLLGVDGTIGYFYPTNVNNRSLGTLPLLFKSATQQLRDANIEVINGSQNSAVMCFPRYSVMDALDKFNEH